MKHQIEDGEHWLSISDMMSGLMVMFLFIAIVFMLKTEESIKQITQEKQKLLNIATTYYTTKETIYQQLHSEFKDDLSKWNAEIDKDSLTIRFKESDILFEVGQYELKQKFKLILNEFCPRYSKVLEQHRNTIEEIRIEGHTSSEWNDKSVSNDEGYFLNMTLSQERTRKTLEYCLMLPNMTSYKSWLKNILIANGLSSSKRLFLNNGMEDVIHSRRVEFKVKTYAEKQIATMLNNK